MDYNNISRPFHYCKGRRFEPVDVINDWQLNFNLGNVIKYVSRAGRKENLLEDLQKAQYYLKYEIDKITQDNCINQYKKDRIEDDI